MAKSKEKNTKKESNYWIFIVITFFIVLTSSIVLGSINGGLQNFGAFKLSQKIPTYALGIAIPSVIVTVLFGIMKSKFAFCGIQGLFLAGSIWLLKYLAIDSTIQINGDGIGKYFYLGAQIVIWLYIVGVVIYGMKSKK